MSTATAPQTISTDHQLSEHASSADDFAGMEDKIVADRAKRQADADTQRQTEIANGLTEAGLAAPEVTPAEQEIGEAAAQAAVKVDNVQ